MYSHNKSCVCNLYNPLCRHKALNLQKQSRLQHLKLYLSLHTELLVKLHLNLYQTIDLRQQLNLQLHLGPIGSLHPPFRASIPLERHKILYHLKHLCFLLFCLFFSSYLLLLDHLANCWILVIQPSAFVSTTGVPSQGNGGGTARGFKGRKFQPIGGNGKNATGKGTKSSK